MRRCGDGSKELSYVDEVGLLEVFETWECLFEVLGKVENFLRDLDDLIFSRSRHRHQFLNSLSADKLGLSELFADLQSYIESTNCLERWSSPLEIIVMQCHLGKVEGHLFD